MDFKKSPLRALVLMSLLMACVSMTVVPSQAASAATCSYMNIDVDVNDGYAVTTIEQKLENNYDTAITDKVQFLIPEDAFMSGFSLIIDGKEYKADILEKQEAQEKFESAVQSGSTAGLLETRGTELFTYSLNFKARQSIIVKLTYEQALTRELDEYKYLQNLKSNHNVKRLNFAMNISSSTGVISVDTPEFDTDITYPEINNARVEYSSVGLPDSDMRVLFSTENTNLNGEMLFYETNGTGYFMHIFSPTANDIGTDPLAKDIIFVIDKSGSMEDLKMEQVKTAFSAIIADLPQEDNFNIVFFDSDVDSYSDELLPANSSNKQKAVELVQSTRASGSTNIDSALRTSLGMFTNASDNVPILIFLTDGKPTVGVESTAWIRNDVKRDNEVGASIFSIAFGEENDYDFEFLQAMSLENRGNAIYFEADSEASEGITGFYDTISTPLVSNLVFSYTDTYDVVHTGKDHLFAGSESIVLGKYEPGTASISSSVTGNTNAGEYSFDDDFVVVTDNPDDYLPRLWAYNTIMDMFDTMTVEGSDDAIVAEITNLSLEYGFVTPYTSFFVEIPQNETSENESINAGQTSEDELDWYVTDDIVMDDAADDYELTSAVYEDEEVVDVNSETYDDEGESFAGMDESADSPGFSALMLISTIGLVLTFLRTRREK